MRSDSLRRSERLRVLHVIDSLLLGGAEQLLVTLARNIDATNFATRVCALTPFEGQGQIPIGLRTEGIRVYSPSGMGRHDPRHVPWLARLIREEGIDLVHTHLPYANVIGLLAAASARRPAVSTIHSVRDRQSGLARLKQRVQGEVLRTQARVVIACSSEVRKSAQERFRISERNMVVVPNSIDTAAYRAYDPSRLCARRCELLGGRVGPVVVSVGSLGPAKGHEYLVDAAARLVGQRGGRFRGLRVVIVGRDRDSGPLVRQRIAAWGLEDRVVLGGECADIATTLAAADLFVDPSVWQGLSLAVLEAMAAGVPVVATAVGEMPRLLEHGRLARLVPPGDPDALAEAMGELLDSPVLAREMAELAREYVQSAHEAASWTRQLEAIYARAVHEPGTQLSLP